MRERVAWWLQRTGALGAVMELRRHAPAPMLSIVTYHHIADNDPAYPYDPNVADAAPLIHEKLTDIVKNTMELDVERFLDGLAAALAVDWSPELEARHAEELIMTWDPVLRLASACVDGERRSRRDRPL